MHYDFDTPVIREGTNAVKLDERLKKFGRGDVLPLWIADMDFMTAPPIREAIARRAEHGIFGYTSRPSSYYEALRAWQSRRYGWDIDTSLVCFNLGVVPALCTAVLELTREGDEVLFMTPVYSEFFEAVLNWRRVPLTSPLVENDGIYAIDFADLEAKIRRGAKLLILCNPHNPVGRVWRREELERVGELCLRHGVTVVSDEIHADLTLWGNRHTPFASLSPELAAITITCLSATKTFNLAGLQASFTVLPNADIKERFESFWSRMDVTRNNCFSLVAVEAAYRYGEPWLVELVEYVQANMLYVKERCERDAPGVAVALPESTYLLWLDCRGLGLDGDDLVRFMVEEAGLGLNDGRSYGAGPGFMRLNAACPRATLELAMDRLASAISRRGARR